jgi:diguanylate cyclase (GGDEF)-like protein
MTFFLEASEMSLLYNLQANLYPLLVLAIVFISLRFSKDHMVRDSRSFKALIFITGILLIGETLMIWASSDNTIFHLVLYRILHIVNFIGLPATALSWIFYILRELSYGIKNRPGIVALLAIPICISIGLTIGSMFTSLYFYVDMNNVYTRGPLFFVHVIVNYSYLLIGLAIVIAQKKKIAPSEFVPMLLFPIPPIIGGIVQTLFYGTNIVLPMLVMSILMIFIFIQTRRVVTDYLTGLNNRRQYEKYIASIRLSGADGKLAGMQIDIDNFKNVNDTYGHYLGDEVLVGIAKLLQDTFDKQDFIARTGGDEFVIFFNVDKARTISNVIKKFLDLLHKYNETSSYPFKIECSYGVDLFHHQKHQTIRSFIAHLDSLMYRQKRIHHGEEEPT